MNKVVINGCYDGFGLSDKGVILYNKYKATSFEGSYDLECSEDFTRHDPVLFRVVEEIGNDENGPRYKLVIQEICGDLYRITEYDGFESIQTPDDLD